MIGLQQHSAGGAWTWGKELVTQALLAHLGYYEGLLDSITGPRTIAALKRFQRDVELEPTGELDAETWGALAFAAEVVEHARTHKDDGPWPDLPPHLLQEFEHLVDSNLEHGVVYGPGCGHVDMEHERFVVVQGSRGPDSAHYRTKRRGPAFVCSTWTYFAAMYLLRQHEHYNDARYGGQPPLWYWTEGEHRVHTGGKFGAWMGLGPFFRFFGSDGSSGKRRPKLGRAGNKDLDLLELWDRFQADPLSVPELLFCAWASVRRGFFHHTTILYCKRATGEIAFIDAGGFKSGGVFSGTPMDVTWIRSRREAQEKASTGWARCWGLEMNGALARELATKVRYGLGYEVEPGVVVAA